MAFQGITIDHQIMAGVPCIRGTRIPVASIVAMMAENMTTEQILADYPQQTTSKRLCATPPPPSTKARFRAWNLREVSG